MWTTTETLIRCFTCGQEIQTGGRIFVYQGVFGANCGCGQNKAEQVFQELLAKEEAEELLGGSTPVV